MNKAMLKAIFIDLDDTIIDTKGVYETTRLRAYHALERTFGTLDFDFDTYRRLSKKRNDELRKITEIAQDRVVGSLIDTAQTLLKGKTIPDPLKTELNRIGGETFSTLPELKDNIEAPLIKLHAQCKQLGIPLIILTQGKKDWQMQKINSLPKALNKLFDQAIIVSDKQPSTYQRILNQLGYNPSETMMIGDKEGSDIIPALKVGMHAIHIPVYQLDFESLTSQTNQTSQNHHQFSSFDQCVEHLLRSDHLKQSKRKTASIKNTP